MTIPMARKSDERCIEPKKKKTLQGEDDKNQNDNNIINALYLRAHAGVFKSEHMRANESEIKCVLINFPGLIEKKCG